ncbi:MAG: GNAT family N-acetyltransferase [Prochloraceae cyanobacterium]|nr:GNAT family N-acetyltransferase [Prochloraceae cyanobacterium]
MSDRDVIIAETSRLIIRHFSAADLESLAPILANQKVMKFSLKGAKTKAETQIFIEKILADYQTKGCGLYAVIFRENMQLIGFCGLFFWPSIAGKEEVEIGYRFDPNYWGRGLATEAAKAVRDYAFTKFNFTSLISLIEPANIASIRVAEKNGMKYEKDDNFLGILARIYRIFKEKEN